MHFMMYTNAQPYILKKLKIFLCYDIQIKVNKRTKIKQLQISKTVTQIILQIYRLPYILPAMCTFWVVAVGRYFPAVDSLLSTISSWLVSANKLVSSDGLLSSKLEMPSRGKCKS